MKSAVHNFVNRIIAGTTKFRYSADSLFFRRSEATLATLNAMRKQVSGGPILVVGNGPSLNETPLDEFSSVPAIGMNKIDLIYPYTNWRPTMVVCVNNLVVHQNQAVFQDSRIPVFLAWKCRWFLGRSKNPNVHYFKNTPTAEFSHDAASGIGSLSPTVTYTALQFAYYLEADPVILLGVDHRFDTDPNARGIETRTAPDANHFSADYFKPGQLWGLPDLSGSAASYRLAKEAFEDAGRTVLDATIDGALDVFPKIDLAAARELLR